MSDSLFLVGRRRAAFGRLPLSALTSAEAIRDAYRSHRRGRWVVPDEDAVRLIAKAVPAHDTWHRVLLLSRATTARRELLQSLFRVVVAPDDGVRLLAVEELVEVLAAERAEDLFIGGVVDEDDHAIVLYRGNLERLVVPLSWFKTSSKGPRPDFGAFRVTDFGQSIQFGDYEASADAILYEFDADARRRMKQNEIALDASFGGALRRLRLSRGLARSDFGPLATKTIARIERGEVNEPHGETLAIIAMRLGVRPDRIKSY